MDNKVLKKEVEDMMTERQHNECAKIIHGAATAAGGVGAFPIPCSDAIGLMAIQTSMVIALARVFNIELTKAMAEHVAKQAVVSSTGKLVATNLTKMIPGLGSVICATVAAGLTEVFGWEQAEAFASHKSLA